MNVPRLRFKNEDGREFSEWEERELKDIAHINPKSDLLPDEFVYIDLESVEKGILLKETTISKDMAPSRAQRLLRKEDVLFQMVRPYQKNNLFFDKIGSYVASTGYAQIRAYEDKRFLYHCLHLENFIAEVMNRCTGTSYPAINSSDLASITIQMPVKEEQTKIANFLTAIDEKITQLTQKHDLLKQYKKGVMQQIFSQKLRFKDDDGREFPEWEELVLADICEFKNGKAHESIISDDGKYFVINSKFISSEGTIYKKTDLALAPIEKDSVVIVMSDVPNGKALAKCFHISTNNLFTLNQRIGSLRSNQHNNKFIYYQINRNPYYLSFDSGVGQTNLKRNEILGCPILLPKSVKEQTKIANFLTAIDDKITQAQAQLEAIKRYKKGLLQQLFV